MNWTTADIPDLSGRVSVVTGANDGLGLETARALAGAGSSVVMAVRNQEKAKAARDDILRTHPGATLKLVPLDLGSLRSVAAAAEAVPASAVDILVNNAGVMALPEGRTSDGFETQLGVNHLGHWALTAHLMDRLLAAEQARVVTVTSTAHHLGRAIDPSNPHLEGRYAPWRAYGQSKLANYHFALGLQREFVRHGMRAQSLLAHPGLSHTNLQVVTAREGGVGASGGFFEGLAARWGMTAADGALPQIRAATDPSARGGEMYAPRYVNTGPPVRRPILRRIGLDRAIRDLWEVSGRETGVAMEISSRT